MKKLIFLIFCALTISSCDDGDVIITSFEFDDVDLEFCKGALEHEFVFFKINKTIDESISLRFVNDQFSDTIVTETPILLDLDTDNNILLYRSFTSPITNDYYCSNIPSSSISIVEERIGTSGKVEIQTKIIEEDDDDGIPKEQEDINGNGNYEDDDTDGDGIPNYKDQDDDNDNILTSVELPNEIPDNDDPRDTDKDGIPDYLEADDDNDGILTRNEDIVEENGNPRDDINPDSGIPYYLDAEATNPKVIDVAPSLDNNVKTTFRTTISVNQLIFNNGNQNFENGNFSFGEKDVTITKTTKIE